jgi:hypothetical protein
LYSLQTLPVLLLTFIALHPAILRNNRFRGLQECGIKLLFSPVHQQRKLVGGNGGNNFLSRSWQKICSLYIGFLYYPFLTSFSQYNSERITSYITSKVIITQL